MNYSLNDQPDTILPALHRRAWTWMRARAKMLARLVWACSFALILTFIGYRIFINWQEIRTYPWQPRPENILLSFGVYSLSLVLTASVWAAIIRRLANKGALVTHIRLFCLSNLANRLPTMLPFIGARTEAYAAIGVPRTVTLTAMTLELAVTLSGAIIVAVTTLPFGPQTEVVARLTPFSALILLPVLLLTIRPAWLIAILNKLLQRFKRSPIQAKVRAFDMLIWIGLFVLIWVNGGFLYYLLTISIYPLSPEYIILIVNAMAVSGVVGWVGQFLFFMPNLALRQLAMTFLLSFVMPLPVAAAVALLGRLCVMIFELLWALMTSVLVRRYWQPEP